MIRLAELESRVLDGLQRRLLDPDAIAAYVREYHAERARLRHTERRRVVDLEKRAEAIAGELGRLVDAIATGLAGAASVRDRIVALEAEKKAVDAERAALRQADDVVALHPKTIERYRARVADLGRALTAAAPGAETARLSAIAILRELVDRIEIGPPAAPGMSATVVAHGLLPRVLAFATQRQRVVNDRTVSLVAGEGLEPPTLGL
jgi:site-specific DNA recombinase